LSDLAVNFKLNIWSNKRVSARFFGFMRSKRPIVISVVLLLLLNYTLLSLCVCVVLVYIKVEISLLWVPLITALKRKRLRLCVSRKS
jgi:hypothetical protein